MLKLEVIEAKDLLAGDRNGFSDPYVLLYHRNLKFKTGVKRKTLNPVWNNEVFNIPVGVEDSGEAIHVKVYDRDLLTKDDFLGSCSVSFQHLFKASAGHWDDNWYPLAPKGALHVRMLLEMNEFQAKWTNLVLHEANVQVKTGKAKWKKRYFLMLKNATETIYSFPSKESPMEFISKYPLTPIGLSVEIYDLRGGMLTIVEEEPTQKRFFKSSTSGKSRPSPGYLAMETNVVEEPLVMVMCESKGHARRWLDLWGTRPPVSVAVEKNLVVEANADEEDLNAQELGYEEPESEVVESDLVDEEEGGKEILELRDEELQDSDENLCEDKCEGGSEEETDVIEEMEKQEEKGAMEDRLVASLTTDDCVIKCPTEVLLSNMKPVKVLTFTDMLMCQFCIAGRR